MPTSQRHSCLWLWSFGSRSASLLPSPPQPILSWGSSCPCFSSWRTETGNTMKNQSFWLPVAGGAQASCCPQGQAGVSAPWLQPHGPRPPAPACPWPPGRTLRPPATGTTLQAVLPLNKRGRGPCAVLLGATGTAGSASFLFSGLSSDRSPMHPPVHPSVCPSVQAFTCQPTPRPSAWSSIRSSTHLPFIHPSTYPSIIQLSIHLPMHPSTHICPSIYPCAY